MPNKGNVYIWKSKPALKSSWRDPRVFKPRSAGTPHGNLRCGASRTAEEGLEGTGLDVQGQKMGRMQSRRRVTDEGVDSGGRMGARYKVQ